MSLEFTSAPVEFPQKKHNLIFLYGTQGVGKTTFGARCKNPVFISAESGVPKGCKGWEVKTWKKIGDCLAWLNANPNEYQTLVIDTMDSVQDLAVQHVESENGKQMMAGLAYAKGWGIIEGMMYQLLRDLMTLCEFGEHDVLVLAHATQRVVPDLLTGCEYERYEPKLEKNVKAAFKEKSDCILFAHRSFPIKTKDKTEQGRRQLGTTDCVVYDAKNRVGMPEILPLDPNTVFSFLSLPDAPEFEVPEMPPTDDSERLKWCEMLVKASKIENERKEKAMAWYLLTPTVSRAYKLRELVR